MNARRGQLPGGMLAMTLLLAQILWACPSTADDSVPLTTLGEGRSDRFGRSVAVAGDVNGDGAADFIVGAYLNDAGGRNAGRAYVFFGGPGADTVPDLVFTGPGPDAEFGYSVAGAGDVNGDGFADVIVGAPYADGSPSAYVERAYVFYGGPSADATPDLILSAGRISLFGMSVSGAGDVNGDGFDDVIAGAPADSGVVGAGKGSAYVYFGGPAADAVPDFVFSSDAVSPPEWLGWSVAGAGDTNGDGWGDLIVGAPRRNAPAGASVEEAAGHAYIYFGGPAADDEPDVNLVYLLDGETSGSWFGQSVASAGDVDRDGRADVIVGAPRSNGGTADWGERGRAYLYLGSDGPVQVPALVLTGEAPFDHFGVSVSGAGDLNGDGFADLVVGAELNDAGGLAAGKVYFFLGGPAADAAPDAHFAGLAAYDHCGVAVAGARDSLDFFGDGHADLIVGAWGSDAGARNGGAAYVLSGTALVGGPPPLLVMDEAAGTGPVAHLLPGGGVAVETMRVAITDSLDLGNLGRPPRDTIPSQARIDFRWHSEPRTPGGYAVAYRYKLDEPDFVTVDSSVRAVSYNVGIGDVVQPGTKVFTLRAVDGVGHESEITRRFQMNFAPNTWFAGPDSTQYPVVPNSGGQRYVTIPNWSSVAPLPASLLSCDSLLLWPAERSPRRTFFEIYIDRVYVRSENDTVNMNSWVVLHSGGADLDSPYDVKVQLTDPGLGDTAICAPGGVARVIRPAWLLGSPIGFRHQYGTLLDPDRTLFSTPSQSGLYPVFDPGSVFRMPVIAGYMPMMLSGKVYLVARSEDGDGQLDRRILSAAAARKLADDVDTGLDVRPGSLVLRSRILTFYVNRNPYFNFENPDFFPKPPEYNGGQVASSPDRTLRLRFYATDPDPFELASRPPGPGGPSSGRVFRHTATVIGRNAVGSDTSYTTPPWLSAGSGSLSIYLDADAPYIVSQSLTLRVELCDCANCEAQPGTGRCVYYEIPVKVPPPFLEGAAPPGRDPPASGSGVSSGSRRSLEP